MFSSFLRNMDAQLGKSGRRQTCVVEPPTCKTGGTVQLFSREGLEDLIRESVIIRQRR